MIAAWMLPVLACAAPGAEDEVAAPPSAAWRSERPPVPAAAPPVLPAFQRAELENGLQIYVTRVPELPLVSLSLVTRGGAARDPASQAGLTSITYRLLEEGTEDLDALAFSDRVADLGARFGSGADRDQGSVSIGGLSRHVDALIGLLADVVRRPRLAEDDLERVKAERLASIERSLSSPQGIAFMLIPSMIYGEDHPFGHPPTGTPASIEGIDLADVRRQHASLFRPDESALIAVGDVDLESMVARAQAAFGDWSAPGASPAPIPPVDPRPRQRIRVVDRPGVAQTMVLAGRPLFARGHPDEQALTLGNEAWGGSFTSRLNMNLREDKGYTYGARSQVAFRQGVGVFIAYAAVQTEVTAASLAEVFREVGRLEDDPLTEVEIELARDGIVRSLTGQFQSTGAIAGAASSLFVYDLGLDYFQTLGPRYAQTSADAIRAAARRYIDGSVLQVLLVGDADRFEKEVEALDLGPVERIDPAAMLGPSPEAAGGSVR
jgi:zinc protease